MSAESRTGVLTFWQGSLLVTAPFVFALVLAFPGTVFSGSSSHAGAEHAPGETSEVDPLVKADRHEGSCHPESASDAKTSGATHSGGTHDTGGCCAIAVCGGACASVCSGVGVSDVLPGTLVPGVNGEDGLALRKVEDTVRPGMQEVPFRPPIVEFAGSAS